MSEHLIKKYALTAWFYDILDYPWERIYQQWRPTLLADLHGEVLEAGVGTGRNLPYYPEDVQLTAIDLSPAMLQRASKRAQKAKCNVTLLTQDATNMLGLPNAHFDWVISTFMCCVMPDNIQPKAIQEFARVLKPGGQFRLLEIVYSKNAKLRARQQRLAKFVEKIYGARFDRKTLQYIKDCDTLEITRTRFLRQDTYLLIEGRKI